MAGVKGRSGRRVWSREERLHHLRDLGVEKGIEYLENEEIPLKDRGPQALEVAKKEIASKADVNIKEENAKSQEITNIIRALLIKDGKLTS